MPVNKIRRAARRVARRVNREIQGFLDRNYSPATPVPIPVPIEREPIGAYNPQLEYNNSGASILDKMREGTSLAESRVYGVNDSSQLSHEGNSGLEASVTSPGNGDLQELAEQAIKEGVSPSGLKGWVKNKIGGARNKAFTIVELLTTVAIITTLMAVLLPSLKAARDTAKSVVCSTHLKEIGNGVHMYANSYNNDIPRGPPVTAGASAGIFDTINKASNHGILFSTKSLPSLEPFYCSEATFYRKEGNPVNGSSGIDSWGVSTTSSSYLWRNASGGALNKRKIIDYSSMDALALENNFYLDAGRYNEHFSGGDLFVNILFGDGHVNGVVDKEKESHSARNKDLIFTWADKQH